MECVRKFINILHSIPKTPKMNAHCERFNRILQDEFIDFHKSELLNPDIFNNKIIDYLVWYNTRRRARRAFQNKLSSLQFTLLLRENNFNLPQERNRGWDLYRKLQEDNSLLKLILRLRILKLLCVSSAVPSSNFSLPLPTIRKLSNSNALSIPLKEKSSSSKYSRPLSFYNDKNFSNPLSRKIKKM